MPSSAPKSPRRPGSDLDAPYVAGDAIPAAEAVEKHGDSAWQLFHELNQQHEARFADTAPASTYHRMNTEDVAWAQTQPMAKAGAGAGRRPVDGAPLFTLESAMLVARRNNRVCPRPERWQELFALLPPRQTRRGVQQPPAPIVGAAWAVTPPLTRRLAFREHIEWAEREGVLENVMAFMQSMPEGDWLHMGED
jgi:hypothetical protein